MSNEIKCLGGSGTHPSGEYTSMGYGGNKGCGIRADGTLACWALYVHSSTLNISTTPVPPPGSYTQVDAGYHQSCAVRADQNAVCWRNSTGDANDQAQGYVREGPFEKVTVDYWQVCGLKTDGTVECRGDRLGPPPVAND